MTSIKKTKIYKFIRKVILFLGLFFVSGFIFNTLVLTLYSSNNIFVNPENLSGQKTALVLGTSKYAISGAENPFYKNRISAVVRLYQAGKINKIILSGHTDGNYNEPNQMKEDLLVKNIPAEIIIKDERGDRTINSILNLKSHYSIIDNIIIVSQTFHLQRALFLAGIYDIDAVGFSAQSPPWQDSYKTYLREIFARIKLLWDILFFQK